MATTVPSSTELIQKLKKIAKSTGDLVKKHPLNTSPTSVPPPFPPSTVNTGGRPGI